jgi:ElaB/YqjD/DUF883 family membrane-anchored ribosome-binding protein
MRVYYREKPRERPTEGSGENHNAPVIMQTLTGPRQSILGLIRNLKEETRRLVRQELQLLKAELAEKFSVMGRNGAMAAAGGLIAYAGLIVFLMGLGWLAAWGLQQAGVQPVLAGFLGLAIVGFLIIGLGVAFLMKGIKSFSSESLAPQRTIHTIQRLKKTEPELAADKVAEEQKKASPEPKKSSKELQERAMRTENQLTDTLGELGERLSPRHINERVKHRIAEKPYRSGLVAMAAGVLSGFFVIRGRRS